MMVTVVQKAKVSRRPARMRGLKKGDVTWAHRGSKGVLAVTRVDFILKLSMV
jgi:hypothetical protein